jgi:hypothetical protein
MARRPLKAALFLAFQLSLPRELGYVVLGALESAKARVSWSRLFTLMLGAAYERGRRQGGDPRRPRTPVPPLDIELCSDEPVPAAAIASPRVRLLANGEPLAELSPKGGHWSAALADQIATLGHWDWWRGVHVPERPPDPGAVLTLSADEGWSRLDQTIRSSSADTVVIALGGAAPDPTALTALDGERVALATGAHTNAGEPPRPVILHSRSTAPDPFPVIGRPPAYLAIRRSAYQALGGFCSEAATLGDQAVVLELTDRALSADWLVATRDVPGRAQDERRVSLQRTRARASLMSRRAKQRGERPPVAPALARLAEGVLPGGPTFSGGVAHGAAWIAGILRSGTPQPRTEPGPEPEENLRMGRSGDRRAGLPG